MMDFNVYFQAHFWDTVRGLKHGIYGPTWRHSIISITVASFGITFALCRPLM